MSTVCWKNNEEASMAGVKWVRVIVGRDGGAWDMLGYVGICFVWGEIEVMLGLEVGHDRNLTYFERSCRLLLTGRLQSGQKYQYEQEMMGLLSTRREWPVGEVRGFQDRWEGRTNGVCWWIQGGLGGRVPRTPPKGWGWQLGKGWDHSPARGRLGAELGLGEKSLGWGYRSLRCLSNNHAEMLREQL